MALPPLPASNTDRAFFTYVTGNVATAQIHVAQMRYRGGLTPLALCNVFHDLLNAIQAANFWAGWRVTGLEIAAAGSNVRLPAPLGGPLATFLGADATGYTAPSEALEFAFQARSPTTGRKGRLALYGVSLALPSNFRVLPSSGSVLAAAIDVLNVGGAVPSDDAFLTIDGDKPSWYPYVNVNYNSYWERELRG